MNSKLLKTGMIGTVVTAICCFTPLLVWVLGAIGLTSLVVYLDVVLLPLLAIFFIVLLVGLFFKFKGRNKNL